jgi:predicted nucleic acid-binding protein
MAQDKILVIDASVAVKWFNPEKGSDKAILIRKSYVAGDIEIEAPSLLVYEVMNALRYNPSFGIDEVKTCLDALHGIQITLYDFSGDYAEQSLELAYRIGITLYDAAYVALARLRGGVLYTADMELVAKAASGDVRHLSEFSVPSDS